MTNTLRRAARSAFKDRHKIQAFLSSVTEQEIVQGIFNCPGNPNDHCWWFKREIQDLRKNVRYDSTTAVYIDVIPGTKHVDTDAHSLLARLKEDKIPAKYIGYKELFCLAVCLSVSRLSACQSVHPSVRSVCLVS
jgi:hypothetical protein